MKRFLVFVCLIIKIRHNNWIDYSVINPNKVMNTLKKYEKVKSRRRAVEKPIRKNGDGIKQGPAGV